MSNRSLKSVIAFDPETQGYKPKAHNLTAEAATDLVTQCAHENEQTRVVDQKDRHRSSDLSKCKLCKQAAEQATQQSGTRTEDAGSDVAAS